MKKIFFIHFNKEELLEKIKPLQLAGYRVSYHYSTETVADIRNDLPDIFVVSLDRLPSHGRKYAEWLWEAKKRQHIPVIFCDGNPEKIVAIKEKLPHAIYCSNKELIKTLRKI